MKAKHLLTEVRTLQEQGILHPNDVYIWLMMAVTELDEKKPVTFTASELMQSTGLSRSSVFRSIKRLREKCLCDTKSVRLTPEYSLTQTLSVSHRHCEKPKKPGSHDTSATNAAALAECPNDTEHPFSPHTPLNPDNNSESIYKYNTLNEEHNEEQKEGIERVNKSNRSKKNKPVKKDAYGEYVTLSEIEYKTLVDRYSEQGAKRMIEILDNYKGSSGKKYASDYRAILNWVVGRYEEEVRRSGYAVRRTGPREYNDPNDFFSGGFAFDEHPENTGR